VAGTFSKIQLPAKLLVLFAFALLLPLAQASVLGNGNSAPPSPLFPTGTVFAAASGTLTSVPAGLSVTFTQTVYSDPGNTFCAGCLDFVYVFTNNGTGPNERYSMSNFGGFMIDVGTMPFGMHDPTTVDRSGLGGTVIGFNFPGSDNIVPGQTTVQLVIMTDARLVFPGTVTAQDGLTANGVALAPAPAIPEPASLGLMSGGLLAIGGWIRKKHLV
jgi:hypothetical protein